MIDSFESALRREKIRKSTCSRDPISLFDGGVVLSE